MSPFFICFLEKKPDQFWKSEPILFVFLQKNRTNFEKVNQNHLVFGQKTLPILKKWTRIICFSDRKRDRFWKSEPESFGFWTENVTNFEKVNQNHLVFCMAWQDSCIYMYDYLILTEISRVKFQRMNLSKWLFCFHRE